MAPVGVSPIRRESRLVGRTDAADRCRCLASRPGRPAGHRATAELAGVPTAVLTGGSGPPLVLLHGPSGNATYWMRVLPELVARCRVLAPELPGHGESGIGPPRWPRTGARLARRPGRGGRPGPAGPGRARAGWGDRGVLRRARRSGAAAGPGGHVRAGSAATGPGLRRGPGRLTGRPERRNPRPTVALLRRRPGPAAGADGRPVGAVACLHLARARTDGCRADLRAEITAIGASGAPSRPTTAAPAPTWSRCCGCSRP